MLKKLILVAGIILAVVWFGGCQSTGTTEEENKIPVQVTPVSRGEVEQSIFYHGDMTAETEVLLFSKIPDRIEKYFADEGDLVKKGDPVAKISATTIDQAARQAYAGLSAAKAQWANMESEYARSKKLFDEDAISRQQFDTIQTQHKGAAAQLEQAEAAYKSASSQMADATITSPIDGIVGKRYLEAGDMASPGQPVASIVQMNQVKIKIEATEVDLGLLKPGQKAEIRVKSYPDRVFTGKILRISPILDPMTRMATVEIILPNPGHLLKPGMYADVKIITGVLRDVLVVPRYAAQERTSMRKINGRDQVIKDYYVYVVDDSLRAEERKLDVTYVNSESLAVEEGVKEGERLVTAGQNNLRDRAPVIIAEEEK